MATNIIISSFRRYSPVSEIMRFFILPVFFGTAALGFPSLADNDNLLTAAHKPIMVVAKESKAKIIPLSDTSLPFAPTLSQFSIEFKNRVVPKTKDNSHVTYRLTAAPITPQPERRVVAKPNLVASTANTPTEPPPRSQPDSLVAAQTSPDARVAYELTDPPHSPPEKKEIEVVSDVPEKASLMGVPVIISVNMDTQFYSWKNDNESSNKGYQFFSPITVTTQFNNFSFGLRSAHIVSRNKTPGHEGLVSTLSDTVLSASYSYTTDSTSIRALLDYNIPTGKDSLDSKENNVLERVDSYLVPLSQFGEGHNITPGINIAHAIGGNSIIGLGGSYSFKGKFDPNSDRVNDIIDPGDEVNLTSQYQYKEKDWSVMGGLSYAYFGRTKRERTDFFQKGQTLSYDLTGRMLLNNISESMGGQLYASVRYTQQSKDKNFSGSANELARESFNVNGDRWYFNVAWSNTFAQRHSLRLAFDLVDSRRNKYPLDSINYDAGRRRLGYGLTYSYFYSRNSYISLTARRFNVKNRAELIDGIGGRNNEELEYTGTNISLSLSHAFSLFYGGNKS